MIVTFWAVFSDGIMGWTDGKAKRISEREREEWYDCIVFEPPKILFILPTVLLSISVLKKCLCAYRKIGKSCSYGCIYCSIIAQLLLWLLVLNKNNGHTRSGGRRIILSASGIFLVVSFFSCLSLFPLILKSHDLKPKKKRSFKVNFGRGRSGFFSDSSYSKRERERESWLC